MRGGAWRMALLLLLLSPFAAVADGEEDRATPGFAVLSASVTEVDGVLRLDAAFALRFGGALEDALRNGVALPLLVEIEALQKRDYLWPKSVAHVEQRYLLSYNPLTEQYLVHNRNSDERFHLPSLAAARALLGSLSRFPFLDRNLLEAGGDYVARLRITLDSEALPVPLRLMSYVSPDWDLQSDWYQWPLRLP